MSNKLKPDLGQARIFLEALDPRGKFTFQTFGEGSAKGNASLARILHGGLEKHAVELERLQQQGAGVFVTVNETDGIGRKEENIKRVRALFVDLDGAPLDPVTKFELKPHIIIQSSPGRWHAYWLVTGIELNEFGELQQALIAKFDADSAVHDLPRVMRLPGFWHQKSEPFQSVVLDSIRHPPFTQADFAQALERDPGNATVDDDDTIVDSEAGSVLRATAARRIAEAAERTHDHPTMGRHPLFLRLGRQLQTSGVPYEIVVDELHRMIGYFRQTDTDGNPSELTAQEALRKIMFAYLRPEDLEPRAKSRAPRDINLTDWTAARYAGSPPERDWLVNEIFPARAVSLVAAMGDTGKSMLMLDLALRVAGIEGRWPDDFMGTEQISEGTAVIITAEDDMHEIHRRIARLRKDRSPLVEPARLIVVSLPDAGGPLTFFRTGYQGPEVTDEFRAVRGQLVALDDLKLVVIDPLQAFVAIDLNRDPAAAQFVCSELAQLATQTGAAIIATHHMRKGSKAEGLSPAETREAVRGSTAIVDGVRCVYALWPADAAKARRDCKALDIEYTTNGIVRGAVVKANWPADRSMRTFARNSVGSLVDETQKIRGTRPEQKDLLEELPKQIALAAKSGNPYTKTGLSGVYQRRHEFPEQFHHVGKHRFDALVQELLDTGKVTACLAQGGRGARWLDVPGGLFDQGKGEFSRGALGRSK